MKKILFVILVMIKSADVYAGDAENIMACVNKAYEFAGIRLSEFEVSYQGNILAFSTAKWSNAYCEVKLGSVYNLQINSNQLIFEGFAGKESYDLNQALEEKTEAAINQLKSRITILEQRMSQVSASLRLPQPNHVSLIQYIDEGIEKSLGSRPQMQKQSSAPMQDTPNKLKSQTGTYQAGWVKVSENDAATYYADLSTIRKNDNMAKMWLMFDLKTAKNPLGEPYMSSKLQVEYDCKEFQLRILYFTLFSDNMGSGKVVHDSSNPENWQPVQPGSMDNSMWKIACAN